MRALLKFVGSVGLPFLALFLVMQLIQRPVPDPPDPPTLTVASASPQQPPSDGRWQVSDDGSFVGYRIRERNLRRGLDGEAVGRTEEVEGFAEVADGLVREAAVTADLTGLTSDEPRRDWIIKVRYLESEAHPEARFTVTEPFALAAGVPDGHVVTHRVRGLLEIRGIEREVVAELQVRWDGDEVAVAGSIPVELADFDIRSPSIRLFRRVADDARIELDLRFAPPADAQASR